MERKLKKYLENGIGFDCNTSELKDLNVEFKRTREIRLEDLTFWENEKKEIQDKLAKIGEEGLDALNIVKKDLLEKQLKETNKKINLLVLSLSYNSMEQFIDKKVNIN